MRKLIPLFALVAACGADLPEIELALNGRPQALGEVLGASVVDGGAQVSLSATRSTDPDGDALTYRWVQVSGSIVDVQNADSATATFVAPEQQSTLVFGLVVNDGYEDSDRTLVQVDVRFNRAPVADAGAPLETPNLKSVTLEGTGTDADGDGIAAYEWTVEAAPIGATYQISGTTTAYPNFTPQGKGVYTLGLRVNDGKAWGLKTSQLVTSKNNPPSAEPWYSGQATWNTYAAGQGVDYVDLDGDAITQTEFSAIQQPPGSSYDAVDLYGNGTYWDFTPYGHGTYVLGFRAFDGEDWGPIATSAVFSENNRPTAAVTPIDPIDNFSTAFLDGAGADVDGDALTYTWTIDSKPAGAGVNLQNGVASPAFRPSGKGTYTLALVVSDGKLASLPATTTVTVRNTAPTANPGPAIPSVSGGTLVQLDGTASSDVDGDPIASYKWTQLSGTAVVLSANNSAAAAQPTFTPTTKGTYQFKLEVHDGETWSGPAYVSVTVDNLAPQTVAPNDFAVAGRTVSVALNGAANDSEGDPIAYTWSQIAGTPVTLVNATQAAAAFTAPAQMGTLTFRLDASDGKGTASDTVNVIVGANGVDHVFVDDSAAPGGTRTQASPLQSVQAGIAAAVTGPRAVVIAEGNYPGNITLSNGVHVYGGFATGAAWTQTGGASYIRQTAGVADIVTIPNTVITPTRLNHVSIRDTGNGSSVGIRCTGCSAVIEYVDLQQDALSAAAANTGLHVQSTGYPVWVSHSTFRTGFSGWTVGVDLLSAGKVKIEDSEIDLRGFNNDGGGHRVGIRSDAAQNLVWLKRSKLHVFLSPAGVCNAIRAGTGAHADSILEGNFIHAQCYSAGDFGGWPQYNAGILWWNAGKLTAVNNTIIGPGSSVPGVNSEPVAFGVYWDPAGPNVMRNNYFDGWNRVYHEYTNIHTSWERNFYGSSVAQAGNIGPAPAGLVATTCPLVDAANGDLHLATGANPCVDAGAENVNPVLPYDYDRQARTIDDPAVADYADGTDIGADER